MTKQIQDKFYFHYEGIHYMTRCENLVVQTLSHMLVVSSIKSLLQSMYAFS